MSHTEVELADVEFRDVESQDVESRDAERRDAEPGNPELEFPDPPQTGDADVDEAINAVAAAVHGPLEEQLAVYEAAHRTLQDRLADVEG